MIKTKQAYAQPLPPERAKPQRNELVPQAEAQITFKAWFTNKLDQDSRIKPHHFDQLRLFMMGLGLKEAEGAPSYEHGLKAYFGC